MKYVFGNHKLYLSCKKNQALIESFKTFSVPQKVQVAVFPPTLLLASSVSVLKSSGIVIGAQHVDAVLAGAYTGGVSALQLKECKVKYALIGHSERRYVFGESDFDIQKQIMCSDEEGILPVVCIGETEEDLQKNKKSYRIKKQIASALLGRNPKKKILFAYEPVWAIASGLKRTPCLPEDADDMIGFIKQEIKKYTPLFVPVLYGGSVDPKNAVFYLEREIIDGVLVGTSSVRKDSFSAIVNAAADFL